MLTPIVHPSLALVLKRLSQSGPPPQPLLLTGPTGVGKGTVARYLARIWNCSASVKPCGRCPSCRAVNAGAGERFTVMDGFDGTSAALTNLKAVAQLLPTAGTHVVLLENADAATAPALQGLLKILEDPPSSNAFLVTSARPERLPRTLVSRCLTLALLPLDITTALNVLADLGVPRSRRESIYAAAGGLPARLIAFAADSEAMVTQITKARAVLHLFTLPLSEALAEIPSQGLNTETAARVLFDLALRPLGLPTVVLPARHVLPNIPARTIAHAVFELLADAAAGRYAPKTIAERVVLRLHRP